MRKFYKPLSVLLTFTMCVSLIAPAFAAEEAEPAPSNQEIVTDAPDTTPGSGDVIVNDENDATIVDGGTNSGQDDADSQDAADDDQDAADDDQDAADDDQDAADDDQDDGDDNQDDGDDQDAADDNQDDGDDQDAADDSQDNGDDQDAADGNQDNGGDQDADDSQESQEELQDTAAVMSAPRRTMARAPLDVDHEADQEEEQGGTEDSGKMKVDAYVLLPSDISTPPEGWTSTGTPKPFYTTGKIEVPADELTNERQDGGSYVLKAPIKGEVLEGGKTVYYTRISWVNGAWHLDGVVTEKTTEQFGFGVAAIQDANGVYNGAIEGNGNQNGWNKFTPEELGKLNAAIAGSGIDLPSGYGDEYKYLSNNNRLPPVPESVKAAANKILQEKGWAAGDDAIEWRFGWDASDGWHLDGIVNSDKATNQENVSIVISDPTGQINEATRKDGQGEDKRHNIASGSFILPDPSTYEGDTYTPSGAQLEKLQEYLKDSNIISTEAGNKDGTINWKFVKNTDSESLSWRLQGVYSPNYAHVYVYVSGQEGDVPEGATPGREVSDGDKNQGSGSGVSGNHWYTVGVIKIPYDTVENIQQLMSGTGAGKYIGDEAKDALLKVIDEENSLSKGQIDALWSSYLSKIDWRGIKVENGADGYVGTDYLTLHLNGFIAPVPTEPEDPTDPTNPTEPTNPGGDSGGGGGTGGGDSGAIDIGDEDVPLAGGVELNLDDHFAYISGYEDGTVRPDGNITREEVAAIFYLLLSETSHAIYDTDVNDFSDVDSGRWSNRAISTLVNAGILTGYEDGTFRPGQDVTRAELSAIAAQFNVMIEYVENPFSDTIGHWAESPISFVADKGWVGGYEDNTFRPQKSITRAEAMVVINNILEREVDEEGLLADAKQWPDNKKDAWYYYEVLEATNSHDYTRRGEGTVENWTAITND